MKLDRLLVEIQNKRTGQTYHGRRISDRRRCVG